MLILFAETFTFTDELYFIASFCWTTTFVKHLSKAAFVFLKAGENFRETTGIIRQIPNASL